MRTDVINSFINYFQNRFCNVMVFDFALVIFLNNFDLIIDSRGMDALSWPIHDEHRFSDASFFYLAHGSMSPRQIVS